ncbi:ABC transporter ATP-binding protein [bacterium]|nr:ABC transporter ATP-binding protein [bacterium]
MQADNSLLKVKNLTKTFRVGRNSVCAVDHISFDIHFKKVVSLVGQSGSGKTTVARMLLNLIKPTEGEIRLQGVDTREFQGKRRLEYWRKVQGIFQDPFGSFNQFFTIKKILGDSLRMRKGDLTREEKHELISQSLKAVHMDPEDVMDKYSFELSGGQMQRIMIARISLINPSVIIADEPTSMVDAVLRSTILKLIMQLRDKQGATIIFITHDIGLAYYVSDHVFIMHEGKIVESGEPEDVIIHPQHPYTKELINDVPTLHKKWEF